MPPPMIAPPQGIAQGDMPGTRDQMPPSGDFEYGNQPAPPRGFLGRMQDPNTIEAAGLLGTIGGNIGKAIDASRGVPSMGNVFGLQEAQAHIDQLAKIEDRRKKNLMEQQKLAMEAQKADEELAANKAGHAVHYDPQRGLGYRQLTPQEIEQRYRQTEKGRHEAEVARAMQIGLQAGGGPPQARPDARTFMALGLPPSLAATMGAAGQVQPPQAGGAPPQQAGPPDYDAMARQLQAAGLPPDVVQGEVARRQQQQQFATAQRQAEEKMNLERAQEERAKAQAKKSSEEIESLNRYRDALTKKAEAEAEYTRKGKPKAGIMDFDKALKAYEAQMNNPRADPEATKLAKNNLLMTLDALATGGDAKAKAILDQMYDGLTPEEKQALLDHLESAGD